MALGTGSHSDRAGHHRLAQDPRSSIRRGRWVQGVPRSRNRSYWHWVHGTDQVTYCGFKPPKDVADTEDHWNPLIRCCRKCLERIGREGY